MNKNEQFYDKQYEWMTQIFDAKVDAYHQELVELVEKKGLKRNLNILELGSGNGEFAVAAAMHEHHVSTVEIIPHAISKMFELAEENNVTRRIKAHQGSFYTISLADKFDAICYWDGFGVGTDADQQLLLHNIDYWLKPDGTVFIDVYAPAYWAKTAGQFMELSQTVCRQYDFDIETNRMLDNWWLTDNSDEKRQQSLRCYEVADFEKMLVNTSLAIEEIIPGGKMDYDSWIFHQQVPIEEAMIYTVILREK
ncbi:class I SAM-dependent methyltransferase [Viridibacillus sp. FSL R5-0477]|uniref:N-methyl-transferase-related protein n=1 Tax=Viridibacillus arenosi FSL R5-213 TaxID=1227360 RepID=W4EZL4_9BACL|nr:MULTISPECIES: class I SAM-dependent methyltransferase [Viridibacillus]ETT85271.1 N-methyl-transferase-related protein [Viridibacillus arenosi FSL R5-213]OMC81008.1 SAM-dependent methyltransferase [Viridibacillus sp. FSL H8-0123]OMC89334.1 SAM-dependent methyltransferase [Viridibacillus arenosi]